MTDLQLYKLKIVKTLTKGISFKTILTMKKVRDHVLQENFLIPNLNFKEVIVEMKNKNQVNKVRFVNNHKDLKS